jgi:hypothetical protein
MRSIGSRRGNPVLRASVEQSSRRRMESWFHPHNGDDPPASDDVHELSHTRAFFERIRGRVLPLMAPAMDVDGAEVRYFGAEGLALWGMRAAQGLVLAYECADSPAQLAERARRWLSCLRTRTAPGMLDRTWGRPVYGARHDPARDTLEIVWSKPGDWCGLVLSESPAERRWNLPQHWQTLEV